MFFGAGVSAHCPLMGVDLLDFQALQPVLDFQAPLASLLDPLALLGLAGREVLAAGLPPGWV